MFAGLPPSLVHMKITVITVVYNAVETIEDTLKSVIEQDYQDIEHIVIDGGSTDGTMDVVNSYRKQLAVVISEPDKGIYDAMNKGVEHASGDIIGTLNSDDWYADIGVLSRVAQSFNDDKDLDAVYGDIVYVTKDEPHSLVRYWESRAYQDGLFEERMDATSSFIVRKEKLLFPLWQI